MLARVERIDADVDLIDVAGQHGVVFQRGQTGSAGRGEAIRIRIPQEKRAEMARRVASELSSLELSGDQAAPPPVAFGALPFDPDDVLTPTEFVVPALQVRRRADGTRWVWRIGPAAQDEGLLAPPPRPPPEEFSVFPDRSHAASRAGVQAALDAIAAGTVEKVVFARAVSVNAERPFDVAGVLRRLRGAYPACLLYSVDGFLGATPEMLIARAGDIVRAQPMAGTAIRSGDPILDAQLAARLAASEKDRHEHRVTIDTLVEGLLPFCSYLDSAAEPSVVTMANVQHLASEVEGRLSHPLPSVLDLVVALHPTPAVGGRPAAAALALIRELEPAGRGRYGGPVGWVDRDGNGEFAVGLRGAQVNGNTARCYGGGGIVAGSDPAAELVETQAKLSAILGALIRP